MKILYAALRHDPRNPDLSSGTDYNFYKSFIRHGFEIKICGPFIGTPIIERAVKKIYTKVTKKRYLKWDFYSMRRSGRALSLAARRWKPDLIFSIFPPPLAFYKGVIPCVFWTDTTFQGWQAEMGVFGRFPLRALIWVEKKAVKRSTKIITSSRWCKNEIIRRHGVEPGKIDIFPMSSALPMKYIPESINIKAEKLLSTPLKLLLVGRAYYRKGIDIAIEITKNLNHIGIKTELTVCGIKGDCDTPYVKFVGPYKKSDPEELKQYIELYKKSNFLIHPARFDPSPIVTAEAAAFGVPTITNDVGGIGTSVKNSESGIVLPKASPPEVYIKTILYFLRNPEDYYDLCKKTRKRYEEELNWEAAGEYVAAILKKL